MQIIAKVPGERCISQQVAQIYESGKSKCRFYGRLLGKYDLLQFLSEYIETRLFITKFTWKMIIEKTVNFQEKLVVAQRLLCSDQYNLLENVIKPGNCSPLWDIARANPNLLTACQTILNSIGLVTSRPFSKKCSLCNLAVDNISVHLMCFLYH
ncbi:hypothetical protein DPMN_122412 [Dreissena polymorpha]|uniref:Uncharacterized protein n=1 Tax=Dreissena polymorpha TaxID=45954 RepID=A0A9D4GSF2_DREPO|nr:hypothetical protein DPMN_122412 [Dreissena polymorpha]